MKSLPSDEIIEIGNALKIDGASERQLPAIKNAADLLADTSISEPVEIIQSIAHQGTKIVFGGGSKSCKTWSLLDCGISVATGLPWLGHRTNRGRVLYINMEILEYFITKRIDKVCEAKKVKRSELENFDVWNLRGHSTGLILLAPQIIRATKERGYSMIILDPIYKLLGGKDENSAGDIGLVCNELERITVETGAAILFATHYSKGNQAGKESIDRMSGSGVFARDPDTIIAFTRHKQEGCFSIEMTLRNLPAQEPFVVEWQYPLMKRRDDLDPEELKQVAGRRKENHEDDLLVLLGDGQMSASQWMQEAHEEFGMSERTFFRLKKILINQGKVHQSPINKKWSKV